MGASCKDQKKALAICLQRSPCVLINRNTPKDCVTKPELAEQVPEICQDLFRNFFECKSGAIDRSKRFRGNGALSTGKYDEAYENLQSGNFDPLEEYRKLKDLDKYSSVRKSKKDDETII